MNTAIHYNCKIVAILALLFTVVGLSGLTLSVSAHNPGAKPAPEFELEAIQIRDGGKLTELTPELLGKYHNERSMESTRERFVSQGMAESEIEKTIDAQYGGATGIGPCGLGVYRAVLYASDILWDGGIINRSELCVENNWNGGGSRDYSLYMTGTSDDVPGVTEPGEFTFVSNNAIIPIDIDYPQIKKLSKDMGIGSMSYIISNLSTGKSVELSLSADIIPLNYFENRRVVKFTQNPDKQIVDEFNLQWEQIRDNLLLLNDYELFNEVDEPPPEVPVIPIIVLGGLLLIILIMWLVSKYRRF